MKLFSYLSLIVVLAGCASHSVEPQNNVYQAFGQKEGLTLIVDDLFVLIENDQRIGPFFAETDNDYIKQQLVNQFCSLLNGPCVYDGMSMKDSHVGLNIRRQHFNALVELLRQAMDQQRVPFTAQNHLLSKLAPMHRDIIES